MPHHRQIKLALWPLDDHNTRNFQTLSIAIYMCFIDAFFPEKKTKYRIVTYLAVEGHY